MAMPKAQSLVRMSEAGLLQVRKMLELDLDRVERNERRAYQFPWTRGIFVDCLTGSNLCLVLQEGDDLLGHAIASVGAGESHLLNLCMRRDQQGRGLGRLLLRSCLDGVKNMGAQMVFLEVRPSNQVAIALYESVGFNEIGLRKGYYPAAIGHEDALVLALDFGQHDFSGSV